MMENTIRLYEELSMNAHPALQQQLYDGWVLRFAGGYTGRANSVTPLYPASLEAGEKVAVCESLYHSRGLRTLFKLTEAAGSLDEMLAARGYGVITPTLLMTVTLQPMDINPGIRLETGLSPSWREASFSLREWGERDRAIASVILSSIPGLTITASLEENGEVAAIGRAVLERGYVGLYDILTTPAHRGRGLGGQICTALLETARQRGAASAYLQVVEDNAPARALYKGLGYKAQYRYWYRAESK
jgi:ribosomal protein S18 acetylase RimI-like enzyme